MGQGFGSQIGRSAVASFLAFGVIAFIAGGFAFQGMLWLVHHVHISAWWK